MCLSVCENVSQLRVGNVLLPRGDARKCAVNEQRDVTSEQPPGP